LLRKIDKPKYLSECICLTYSGMHEESEMIILSTLSGCWKKNGRCGKKA